jgi:hypothetical protein
MDLEHIPPRNDVPGGELFEPDPWYGAEVQRINLNEIPRDPGLIVAGFADRIGPRRPPLVG